MSQGCENTRAGKLSNRLAGLETPATFVGWERPLDFDLRERNEIFRDHEHDSQVQDYIKNQKAIVDSNRQPPNCDSTHCWFQKAPDFDNLLVYGRHGESNWEAPKIDCKECDGRTFTGIFYQKRDNRYHYGLCGNPLSNCPKIGNYTPEGKIMYRTGSIRYDERIGTDRRTDATHPSFVECKYPLDSIQNSNDYETLKSQVNQQKVANVFLNKGLEEPMLAGYCFDSKDQGRTYPNMADPLCQDLCLNKGVRQSDVYYNKCDMANWKNEYCTGDKVVDLDTNNECNTWCTNNNIKCHSRRAAYCQKEYNELVQILKDAKDGYTYVEEVESIPIPRPTQPAPSSCYLM